MKSKISLFALCTLSSSLALADITVSNNTDLYGTAKVGFICSAIAGDRGIIHPQQQDFVIPTYALKEFCSNKPCSARIYATEHCDRGGSQPLATVQIAYPDGMVGEPVYSTPQQIKISGGGDHVYVDPIGSRFGRWVKSLF